MGNFVQDTLSFYHTFSKTQVNKNAPFNSLGNSINKSGHTVQASDVWADDIPFFAEKGTTGEVHSIFSAHAQTNDLVKVGSKIYQRNATPYSSEATFDTLWSEKTKSITDWSIVDGEYQYTEVDGALVDGSYLVNAAGKPVIKYYERAQLSILTAANNANVTSNKLASRLKVGGTWGTDSKESVPFMNGGRWVEQFVTVTDKYVNGEAATIYAPQVYLTSTAAAPQVAGTVYFDFCATGVILWDSRTADGKEVITCFEYVGDKLSNALTNISSEIEDIVSTTMEGVVASVGTTNAATTAGLSIKGTKTAPTVDITTGSVTAGEAKLVTGGAVATVTDALAGRIAQLEGIQHFSVAVVDALPETPVENTIYLVPEEGKTSGNYVEYIAYKPAGSETVTTERIGTTAIDLSGYTTDGEHEALQGRVSAIETTTVPALEQSIADAKSEAATNLATARGEITAEIAQAKSEAIASAEVTITAGTGIVVTGEGKGTTFQIAVSDDVATAASVSALSQVVASNKTELEGKIAAAQSAAENAQGAADAAMAEAQAKVASITTGTVPEGVTITTGTTPQLSIVTAPDSSSGNGSKLVTKQVAESIASGYANDAANAVKGQSLAQTGTLSGMFSVATTGTVGTGITGITITDAGLGQAISDAKKAGTDAATAVETLSSKSVNYSTSLGSDANTVTVALGGEVGSPKVQITNVAAASALTALETKVDNFHKAGVSYKVLSELPTASVDYNGVIVLVPTLDASNAEGDKKEAISGSYVEHLCVNKGTEEAPQWAWEQIGTTAADLHGYVNAIDSSSIQSVYSSVYASISSTGYLSIGANHASDSVMGVSKMFTGNDITTLGNLTDTAVSVKSAKAMYSTLATLADSKVSDVTADYYLSLAGFMVLTTSDAPTARVIESGLLHSAIVHSIVKSSNPETVEGGILTADNGVKRVLATDKIVNGTNMFTSTHIETWVDDLSNMTNGTAMFKNCAQLTTFVGDLSSLETADEMFYGCTLDAESLEILADTLPTVTSGTIDIGASTNATEEVITTIKGKGWTVKSNGTTL